MEPEQRPRDDRADPRNGALIAAAAELLGEAGLEGLTIRAVLARTGLARRAFYDRFGGKDDLMLAVFEQSLREAAVHFAVIADGEADPINRLRLIVQGIVSGSSVEEPGQKTESYRRGAALSREHLRLADARPADLERAVRPLVAVIASELEAGMRLGVVRQCDPQRLATLVYNLVSTTIHVEMLADADGSPQRQRRTALAEEIWLFCRGAIVA